MSNHRDIRNIVIIILFLVIVGVLIWALFTGFSQDAIWVAIGVASLSALFSAVTAVASWIQADEARKQRAMHERPYIMGFFEGAYGGVLYFVLKNVGNSPAVDVKVRFDPAPVDARGRSLNKLSIYREPISFFPQGKSYRQLVDASFRFLSDENPANFRVDFAYKTIHGETIEDHIDFDLEYLRDSHLPGRTIEESLSKIADEHKKMNSALNKFIRNNSLIIQTRQEYIKGLEEFLTRDNDSQEE